MGGLYFKYYANVTLYNLAFCIICPVIGVKLMGCIIIFGTIGCLASFSIYKYFQNAEYYFYANKGLSKTHLQLKTFIINLTISAFTALSLWAII